MKRLLLFGFAMLFAVATFAETYRIYRDGVQIGTSATPSYSDSGLAPETTYTYTVTAVDEVTGLESAPSAPLAITTAALPPDPPAAPANLQGSATGPDTATLSWESGETPPPPTTQGVILEDWSDFRQNPSLGEPLFKPFFNLGASGSQVLSLNGDGTMRCTLNGQAGGEIYWHFHPYPYVYPNGFTRGWIESGTWDESINRMILWVKVNQTIVDTSEGHLNVGNYAKPITDGGSANQGAHFYWLMGLTTLHANRWAKLTLTPKQQHEVGTPGGTEHPINPQFMSELTRWYFQHDQVPNNTVWDFSPITFETVTGEPDDLVASITATYSGTRYELSWSGPKNALQVYEVAYSTTSMKQSGFGVGGTISPTQPETQQNDFTRVRWEGPAMAEADDMYLAIRPVGTAAFTEIHLPKR